jgi:hypothetical protein
VLPAAAGATEPQITAPAAAPAPRSSGISQANAAPATTPAAAQNTVDSLARLGQSLMQRSHLPAGYWPWIAALLALAWLFSTALWLRARAANIGGAGSRPERPAAAPTPQPGKALTRLEKACRANDARAARQALLEWAAARWPDHPPRRLETLGRRLDDNATGLLRALDQELYAPTPQGWDGGEFWRRLAPALKGSSQRRAVSTQDAVLPPLYQQRA